jgi:hypothetical protein
MLMQMRPVAGPDDDTDAPLSWITRWAELHMDTVASSSSLWHTQSA